MFEILRLRSFEELIFQLVKKVNYLEIGAYFKGRIKLVPFWFYFE